MGSHLPDNGDFNAFTVVELDAEGRLLDRGVPVPPADVPGHLAKRLHVPPPATDIFVFVHGWQHDRRTAAAAARRLFAAIWTNGLRDVASYPALARFRPAFVCVQWPSRSNPFPWGYRRIRDRAHAMTNSGHAAHVLAALLGYLDQIRRRPPAVDVLWNARGQYLHCVGHSFGCRMLGEAISAAADPPANPTLAWPWRSRFPFAVDSFVGFQMAAPPDIFSNRFRPLIEGRAPIAGPVVLTSSPHDRALSMWHRIPEGARGLGAVGAAGAPTIRMRRLCEKYTGAEFTKLTNVDAGWLYRSGAFTFQGAHSDFWRPESVHLLLSLAHLSR